MLGQTVGSVDALDHLTQTQLNADGQTTAIIDPDGNVTK
jgi:YD repeat-containing protein